MYYVFFLYTNGLSLLLLGYVASILETTHPIQSDVLISPLTLFRKEI